MFNWVLNMSLDTFSKLLYKLLWCFENCGRSTHTKLPHPPPPPPPTKQVQEVHETGLLQSGYSQLNCLKRHLQITVSKTSYSLIDRQLLHCTPACGYKLHALPVHLYPTFTASPMRLLRHFRRSLEIKETITNVPRVL